ncbi:outer membrane beta-barrel domain-containing protein [Paraliomyxa miuraensis]|uniref:outer membrane beta-barrel domain-containing protein n=1 Tax=Paraliomyxa miuraensis TaxID=376150 RepID=UPI00225438E6|nr:outer membrane beta-barrel domain-containing protein [Paraliomyxa miuraensis]MCX4245809.1 outer membrane beta-barrel domain-containing protein [Paraliomyxa miuraensis]
MPATALAAAPPVSWGAVSATYVDGQLDDQSADEPEDEEELVIVDDEEMEGGGEPSGDGDVVVDDGDGGGGDLDVFGDDGGSAGAAASAEEAAPDANSEEDQIKAEMGLITVVQRQRMLKKKRFELQPQFGITVNDPYVRHYTVGVEADYWISNRMALGLGGTGLIGAKTPRYDNIRRQEGLLLTANEVLWQANVDFTYNFMYGKIAIFNRALLHWEAGGSIGGAVMQTRVIPRYESLHEPFSNFTGGGLVALKTRTYLPRVNWFAFDLGVRYLLFADRLEPGTRGPDTTPGTGVDDPALDDPAEAKAASSPQLAHNVTFYLGVSFFFPTSFEYTTPR